MKCHRLSILLLTLLLSTILQATAHPAVGSNRRADINADGEVDAGDVNALLEVVLSDGQYAMSKDINADGRIDVGDINEVLRLIMHPEAYHDPEEYLSRTLPVLYIDTEYYRPVNSKDYYLQAHYWLDPMGNADVKAQGSREKPLPLQIKGRGNYSWTAFDKKPYRIKLDKKADLLGMKPSKHWCLLAHADAGLAFLRNHVGFEFSRLFKLQWTPADKPLELVLNGEYIGIYFLTEKIRVDSDRVDIEEQRDNETRPEYITGGWLLEIDNYHDSANQLMFPNYLNITYHSPEVLSTAQHDYLYKLILKTDSLFRVAEQSDEIWDVVDLKAFAQFYIVNEIVDNQESFSGSCYFYKDKGDSTKLHFGPVWDFGSSVSLRRLDADPSNMGFFYNNFSEKGYAHWLPFAVKNKSFNQMVRRVWKQTYNQRILIHLDKFINAYISTITPAARCDKRRWPELYANGVYGGNVIVYKTFLYNKLRWLDNQWRQSKVIR